LALSSGLTDGAALLLFAAKVVVAITDGTRAAKSADLTKRFMKSSFLWSISLLWSQDNSKWLLWTQ
jgi:hypothetical protein